MSANDTNSAKRLYYISPENLEHLRKRAPRTGHQGGGLPNVNIALNSVIQRYDALMSYAQRRVLSALSEPEDRQFVRGVLLGVATDDLTASEDPLAYIRDIEEAMQEYEPGQEFFTPNLRIALQSFGPLEAMALVDWIEQEKAKRD